MANLILICWARLPNRWQLLRTIDYGGCCWLPVLQRVRIVALNNRGVAGETEYALPEEWEASKVEAYCFATSSMDGWCRTACI